MGAFKYVNALWRKKQSDVMRFLLRIRAWEYRQLPTLLRITRPSRPEKAHKMGYKAKQGYVIYRIRVRRGGRKKMVPKGINSGKPSSHGIILKHHKNLQAIAEQKVGKRLPGLRFLNSYWVNQDAKYKWYECILVDPFHAKVRNDSAISWIAKPKHKHREQRGKTSAGRKYRGLRNKGIGSEKLRSSKKANWIRTNTLKLARRR